MGEGSCANRLGRSCGTCLWFRSATNPKESLREKTVCWHLPFEATEQDLSGWFTQAGVSGVQVTLIRDQLSGKLRGFGFVEVTNDEEATRAVQALNGQDFMGRNVVVNEARPKEGGGRGGFGGGGNGRGGQGRGSQGRGGVVGMAAAEGIAIAGISYPACVNCTTIAPVLYNLGRFGPGSFDGHAREASDENEAFCFWRRVRPGGCSSFLDGGEACCGGRQTDHAHEPLGAFANHAIYR
jgi:hypothetical protein